MTRVSEDTTQPRGGVTRGDPSLGHGPGNKTTDGFMVRDQPSHAPSPASCSCARFLVPSPNRPASLSPPDATCTRTTRSCLKPHQPYATTSPLHETTPCPANCYTILNCQYVIFIPSLHTPPHPTQPHSPSPPIINKEATPPRPRLPITNYRKKPFRVEKKRV